MAVVRLAVLGDVHGAFTEADVEWLSTSSYDAILFVGDLGSWVRTRRTFEVARLISRLRRPTFVIPGNHDCTSIGQLGREVLGLPRIDLLDARTQNVRVERLKTVLGEAVLCGYSAHSLAADLGLIAARPHSMGGKLNFAPYLERRFDIASMEQSAHRLCQLVDDCPHERLVFLAHNGPSGLGEAEDDIWGCDFKKEAGDWGDPDLRAAIDHAIASGREVLAVVAGHMHHRTKQRALRTWHVQAEGVHYVNAARVPRLCRVDGERRRHHVEVLIGAEGVRVSEVLVPDIRPSAGVLG